MSDTNILGVYFWKDDTGNYSYRCRGIGKDYNYFYDTWILNSSYRSISNDFPWDFFVFDDPKDHDKLIKDYEECVFED